LVLLGTAVFYGWKAISRIHWGSSKPKTVDSASLPEPLKVADKYQHLIIKALDKSWVLVTVDNGQSKSEADMVKGQVKAYRALKNFKLKLGNAGGVDVQFNGRPLGILGTTGQVVEITLPNGPEAKPGVSAEP